MIGTLFSSRRWGHVAALTALVALGWLLPAAAAGQLGARIAITIDTPSAGSVITNGHATTIGGWAVDYGSARGTGVDAVMISIDGPPSAGTPSVAAPYGSARPDVAQQFGRPDWTQSGFSVSWTPEGLTTGQHTLVVSAHSPQSGWSSNAVTVTVVAAPSYGGPPPAVVLPPRLGPPPGSRGAPFVPAPLAPGLPPPCAFSPYDLDLPPCPR
jgi:hypothetical protein